MSGSDHHQRIFAGAADYDAVIVGASIAGCVTAFALGRRGARVALVEQRPDPQAFKRVCTHFIQASAVPTLDRLGLTEPLMAAGAVRSGLRLWTRWGWIVAPPEDGVEGINIRREKLDPLLRELAAQTPGVELLLGRSAQRLVRDDADGICGVVVRERDGGERTLRARLVVGADGRGSRVAELAGVKARVSEHGRIAYAAYFENATPEFAPDTAVWFCDPQWGGAFPTDDGLVAYAAMPTKDRLPEFRRDPDRALVNFVADLPDAPPILEGRRVGPTIGKLEMPNVMHEPTAPGLALVGDAALSADPLWGVGCGWALQSAEWLADGVAPALGGEEPLAAGLTRYRRRWLRGLRGHATVLEDFATGRRLNPGERFIFSAAAREPRVASITAAFGSRRIGPVRALATSLPPAIAANARHVLRGRPQHPPIASVASVAAAPAASGAREPVRVPEAVGS